MIIIFYYRPVL